MLVTMARPVISVGSPAAQRFVCKLQRVTIVSRLPVVCRRRDSRRDGPGRTDRSGTRSRYLRLYRRCSALSFVQQTCLSRRLLLQRSCRSLAAAATNGFGAGGQ